MSRSPAMTALLNGQAVNVGLGSTRVISNPASARCSARAHPAPPKPPPRITIRGLVWAIAGVTSSAAPPIKNALRVVRTTGRSSMLPAQPSGNRPDLVAGKAFRYPPHHRRRALAGAKGLHRRDDLGRIAAADRWHLGFWRGGRRVAARTLCRPWRRLGRRRRRSEECEYERQKRPHARFRSWPFSGSERTRLPVAAKIALHSAGARGGTAGSPPPPQNPPLATTAVSTTGMPARRSIS